MVEQLELCGALNMSTSSMFANSESIFVNGRKPRSSTSKGHLYPVACADHFVMVLMEILSCLFLPRKPAIPDFPGFGACMPGKACEGNLFPLPQHGHNFAVVSKCKTWLNRRDSIPYYSV